MPSSAMKCILSCGLLLALSLPKVASETISLCITSDDLDTRSKLESSFSTISKYAKNNNQIDAVVNLGNIKSGSGSCITQAYAAISNSITQSVGGAYSVWNTIGENEYAKCSNPNSALDAWKSVFAQSNENLPYFSGYDVTRQLDQEENWYIINNRVLFFGLNLMGDLGRINGNEYKAKMKRQQKFVKKTINKNTGEGSDNVDAVVFLAHGYNPDPSDRHLNKFFIPIRNFLTNGFDGGLPVIYVHASEEKSDGSISLNENFYNVENFYELSIPSSSNNNELFKLTIDTATEGVFYPSIESADSVGDEGGDGGDVGSGDDPRLYAAIKKISSESDLQDTSSPQYMAWQWSITKDRLGPKVSMARRVTRYALAVIYYSLEMPNTEANLLANIDECSWKGVKCNGNRDVTTLNLARQKLTGVIPSEIAFFEKSLSVLDLAENSIVGSIDAVYSLKNLKDLYLHDNQLSGGLSNEVANWSKLINMYLGNNNFSGTIPSAITSIQNLRFLMLYKNQFNGSIPRDIGRLGKVFYLDLSYNNLTGPLPESLEDNRKLRLLYLEHNRLSGKVPNGYSRLGQGFLIAMHLNNNELSGALPWQWRGEKHLITIRLQHNRFNQKIPGSLCDNWVLTGRAELVELGADCNICKCNFCRGRCY